MDTAVFTSKNYSIGVGSIPTQAILIVAEDYL